METMRIFTDVMNFILPIIAIIISIYTLIKQHNLEKKTSAPCIIIHKDEILLDNNWSFTKDETIKGKSVNIRSSVLSRNSRQEKEESELFTTIILNYSNKDINLFDVTDPDCTRFFNHSIRLLGLSENFTHKFFKSVRDLKEKSFNKEIHERNLINIKKYTSKELTKMCTNYCKFN